MEFSPSVAPNRVEKPVEGVQGIPGKFTISHGDLHETQPTALSRQVKALVQKEEPRSESLTLLIHTKTSHVVVKVDISRVRSDIERVYIIRQVAANVSSTWTSLGVLRYYMEVSEAAIRNVSALATFLSTRGFYLEILAADTGQFRIRDGIVETSDYTGMEYLNLANAVTLLPMLWKGDLSYDHYRTAYNLMRPAEFEIDHESGEKYRSGLVIRLRRNWASFYLDLPFLEACLVAALVIDSLEQSGCDIQVSLHIFAFITYLLFLRICMLISGRQSGRHFIPLLLPIVIIEIYMLIFRKELKLYDFAFIGLSVPPLFIYFLGESISLRKLANGLHRKILEKQSESILNRVPQMVPPGMTRGSWTCVSGAPSILMQTNI